MPTLGYLVAVRLPADLYDALEKTASGQFFQGVDSSFGTMSHVIRTACREYLNRNSRHKKGKAKCKPRVRQSVAPRS